MTKWLTCLVIATLLCGCASVRDRNPASKDVYETARIPGIPHARFWGDSLPPDIESRLQVMQEQRRRAHPQAAPQKVYRYLALSGGGCDGAFGAGLLLGWTAAGDRPEFDVVTGVSTGALIAPFAFLGPKYDSQLKTVYTEVTSDDIMEERSLLDMFTGDSLADTTPLKKLIDKFVNENMMKDIAREYNGGRRLLIGTTNLDAKRPVIWNIGAIAARGKPEDLALIRNVLLASAAIPGAFPPVYIDVETTKGMCDELHVDGGATSQVFLYPAALNLREASKQIGLKGKHQVYVISNAKLDPEWEAVKPKLLPIALDSISTLILTQSIGDLYRIYLGAKRDGLDYNLAYIPKDFKVKCEEQFDKAYMNALFKRGYDLAKAGYPWQKAPPGFMPPELIKAKAAGEAHGSE